MTNCKKCGREILFLKTTAGARIPVNADSVSVNQQSGIIAGFDVYFDPKEGHRTHFADCPFADKFRTKKKNPDLPLTSI